MAARFSVEQINEIADALKSLPDKSSLLNLNELVKCIREHCTTAFTETDVDSIASAVAALDNSRDTKPEWTANAERGLFIVFEGLDRSGKSTQSKRLAKHLEESGQVKWMCFPNRETPVGSLIDLYLRNNIELPDETIHKLFSANRWETAHRIVEEMNQGISIVCDRYAFSGVAYSAAKGLDLAWCQSTDVGLPVPDSIFYLYIDEKTGASRANFGDERYENVDMQSRVRLEFKKPELRANVAWHDIDGARDIDTIHTEIRTTVEGIWAKDKENGVNAEGKRRKCEAPIRRLWM